MFRKSYKISVKNSCEEDWKQMKEVSCGRYCNACSKVVYDYTNLSPSEIIKSLKSPTEQKCGRFRTDQLDKAFYLENANPNNITKKSLKYFLSLFIVSLHAKNLSGQTNDSILNQTNIVKVDSSLDMLDDTALVQPVDSNLLVDELDTTLNVETSNSLIVSEEFIFSSEFIYPFDSGMVMGNFIGVQEVDFWRQIKKQLNFMFTKPQNHSDTEYSSTIEDKSKEEENKENNSFTWEMILPPMFRFRRKLKKK